MLGSICRGVPSEMPKLKFQTLFLGPVVCAMAVVFAASAGAGDAGVRRLIAARQVPSVQPHPAIPFPTPGEAPSC